MKFLIDMPLSPGLARRLAELGHEALHVSHAGMSRAPDTAILDHARRDHRVVITADLDYPRLLAMTQEDAPGLILFRGGDYTEDEAWERLRHLLAEVPESELPHSIFVIEKARIRRRRLPIQRQD